VSLQEFVTELHKKQGLSQTEIAKKSGLSQGQIYKVLTGIGKHRRRTYGALATAFPRAWSDYLRRRPTFRAELRDAFGWTTSPGYPTVAQEADPIEFFESSLGLDSAARLSAQGRERYRVRVREVMREAKHKLEEYKKALEAESETARGHRGRKS
jgi:transcriptional regulator with XRE-family HTH domain